MIPATESVSWTSSVDLELIGHFCRAGGMQSFSSLWLFTLVLSQQFLEEEGTTER